MSCHILIGCTGSVATIKLPELVTELYKNVEAAEVKIVLTQHSRHFVSGPLGEDKQPTVLTDENEWLTWQRRSDPVLHVDLRNWADIFVIAPLSANSLAKISTGICDNLLTCILRAWDMRKPVLFAPAMNTHMWNHPITAQQIQTLKSWGYCEIPCIEKTLACGDTGIGAMASVSTIVSTVKDKLSNEVSSTNIHSPLLLTE